MTMPNVREPLLNPVPITELRPTQITVGMREVKAKRKRWREEGDTKGAEFLGRLAGGYAKDTTPFSEFLWADFLRRRMKRQNVEKDFDAALEEACN
jgi:hypothetical protein